MIFKNARVYFGNIKFTQDQLLEALRNLPAFTAYEGIGECTQGWVPPFEWSDLVFSVGHYSLICYQTETPAIPSSSVKLKLNRQVDEFKAREGHYPSKAEKLAIQQAIIDDFRKTAPTTIQALYAYIDFKKGRIVFDATSESKCFVILDKLRQAFESLPVQAWHTQDPSRVLWEWMLEKRNLNHFIILDQCTLKHQLDSSIQLSQKGLDIHNDTFQEMLQDGLIPSKIDIQYDSKIHFTLEDTMNLLKLKFGDFFDEELDRVDQDDDKALADSYFFIMTRELDDIIDKLLEHFPLSSK